MSFRDLPERRFSGYALACILVFLFIPCIKASATSNLVFDHITIRDGLSSNGINEIFQDESGFIWLGTENGLNRYDGYGFRHFHYIPGDTTSINNNTVSTICQTSGDNFFAGTFLGINMYKADSETFSRIPIYLDGQVINTKVYIIVRTRNNNFIAATTDGLFYFRESARSFQLFLPNGLPESLARKHITSLYVDQDGLIWIGSHDHGIHCYDPGRQNTIEIKHNIDGRNTLHDNKIIHINGDSDNTIWFATNIGVYRFNKNTFEIIRYERGEEITKKGIADKSALFVFEYSEDQVWILTRNGLSVFYKSTNSFSHHFHDPFNRKSLTSNVLNIAFVDRLDNVWIGSSMDGINLIRNHFFEFNNVISHTVSTSLARNDFILSITEDNKERLWLGTYGNGINVVDFAGGNHHNINSINTPALRADHVQCLLHDTSGQVWIGTYLGGITVYDIAEDTYRTYMHNEDDINSLPNNIVNALFEDAQNRIWVATHRGLSLYLPETGSFRNFSSFQDARFEMSFANRIAEDKNQNMWISTFSGLFFMNPRLGEVIYYGYSDKGGLSDNTVLSVFCDSQGRIWAGTLNGLNLFDDETGRFRHFFRSDGLPDNTIMGITDDNNGNIWLSTPGGLSKLNTESFTFHTFSIKDGLVNDNFSLNSVYKDQRGKLYFGTKRGLIYFNPEHIDNIQVDHSPRIHLTSMRIFDDYIVPGEHSIITEVIDQTERIRLKYHESFISIGFTTFNYVNPYAESFSYYLEGHDYGWINLESSNTITYTRIPPGKYTLHIRAINNLSQAEATRTLDILVKPPIWRSTVSYFFYFAVITGIVYFVYSYLQSKARYRHSLLLERLEKEKANELNQSKTRFFINAAHEFKTPLTLILSPLERLISKEDTQDPDTRMQLTNLVYRNARLLNRLVNQIMDLKNIDEGDISLKAQKKDIVALLSELSGYFTDYAINHGIHFSFNTEIERFYLWIDNEKAEKIFLNLLSNAFKNTPDGQSVEINIARPQSISSHNKESHVFNEYLAITVADSGQGIAAEHHEKIFDRFYQINENQTADPSSSGIGLSIVKEYVELHKGLIRLQSEPAKGSRFTVYLPTGNTHLSAGEFITEEVADIYPESSIKSQMTINETAKEDISYDCRTAKVLIVEDNYELRNYMVDSLNTEFDVYEAADGMEGLTIAGDVLPRLIVSDIMMPKMNGYELCREVKTDVRLSHIPVILLTVLDTKENIIEGFDEGADDYLNKPFDLDILIARIRNLLVSREKLKQRYLSGPNTDIRQIVHSKTDHIFVTKANKILKKHLSSIDFTAEDFAQEIGMSRSNLHIKMRALTNQSTTEFMRTYRLREAGKLLAKHEYNISEVAYMVGFNNISYFNRCFKKLYKVTPSEFLEKG